MGAGAGRAGRRRAGTQAGLTGVRLLLVEDDSRLSDPLRRDLERAGYAVDVAGDGEQGEYLGNAEPYDVIVLDLGLPRRSGL